MEMITEYYEWCHTIEPGWVGYTVWLTASISVLVFAVLIIVEVVDRIGLWLLWSIPAFIAYFFYIAVFAQ